MRTDVLDCYEFYRTALGAATRDFIGGRLTEAWGDGAGLAVAGFGYANPYLELLGGASRRLILSPGGQGVIRWPSDGRNAASLVGEYHWPLADASIDRLLIVHGLEESPDPQRLLREAWRVLANDGRLIIVAAHRRGLWSMIDSTPFAAGRPFLKRQLNALLEGAMFRAERWSAALYFPPLRKRLLLRAARAWERAGARVWPGFSGVLLVDAAKDMMAPIGVVRSARGRVARPVLAAPQPARLNPAHGSGYTQGPQERG